MTTIEGLLKRLKTSENDSEKFALLIVISKVVKPDLMNPELQEKLSQAVSFKFVFRLLNVDSTRENAALYWQIAAAVLKTCFLSQDYFRSLLGCAERLIQVRVCFKSCFLITYSKHIVNMYYTFENFRV